MITNAITLVQAAAEHTPKDLTSRSECNDALLLAFKEQLYHERRGRYPFVDSAGETRMILGFDL